MREEHEPVVVYTDGGADPNPGIGAWACVLAYRGHIRELVGGEDDTTNNRMEMSAAIAALDTLKRRCRVRIYTDSMYLKNGITVWLPAWKRRNWQRKTGELKNIDLWRLLDELTQHHEVAWEWVRGHAGNELNERCDELVGLEIARRRGANSSRAMGGG